MRRQPRHGPMRGLDTEVPLPISDAVRALAAKRRCTIAEVVGEALALYVNAHGPGLPDAFDLVVALVEHAPMTSGRHLNPHGAVVLYRERLLALLAYAGAGRRTYDRTVRRPESPPVES